MIHICIHHSLARHRRMRFKAEFFLDKFWGTAYKCFLCGYFVAIL